MYWRTGAVQNFTVENVFRSDKSFYRFIDMHIGEKYEMLRSDADKYFHKNDKDYFSQLSTPLNFLGFIELDNDEIICKNILLDYIYKNPNEYKNYLNYFNVMWQFPLPNVAEFRDDRVHKPYLMVLKYLYELKCIDVNSAYITEDEFYNSFLVEENKVTDIESINCEYAQNIIKLREKKAKDFDEDVNKKQEQKLDEVKKLVERLINSNKYVPKDFLVIKSKRISFKQHKDTNEKAKSILDKSLNKLNEFNDAEKKVIYLVNFIYQLKNIIGNQSFLTYEEINEHILDKDWPEIVSEKCESIIESRNNKVLNLGRKLQFFRALLKNSDLLTTIEEDKNGEKVFYMLKTSNVVEYKCLYLFRNWNNINFEFKHISNNSRDKSVITKYARCINDFEKYKKWRKEYMLIDRIDKFKDYCLLKGFYYKEDVIRRFVLSLETKSFLILTGISGSGKTKIAELWTKFLKEKNEAYGIQIAVGSNWTDNKQLLGYKNILLEEGKNYQSTELVDLMIEANKDENSENEYIIILDEMNLSRVEMYFADFLSALESLEHSITLPNGEYVIWTENIKIIGTVNVDESTYMFSPKVLDRANVIEMNGISPKAYIESVKNIDGKVYAKIEKYSWYSKYIDILENVYEALNNEFAFRVIDEMSKYLLINTSLFGDSEELFDKYMDEQLNQKVLPKLHGSKAQLKPKLDRLFNIFGEKEQYTLVNTKLRKMQEDVKKGYASYIGD